MSQPSGKFTHFVRELKRRRVLRAVIPYLAGCWILLQMGSIMLPVLGIPYFYFYALIGFLAALLPAVIIVAWKYQLTSHGFVRTPPFAERRVLNNIPPKKDRRLSLKRNPNGAAQHAGSGWSIYAKSGPVEGLEYAISDAITIGRAIECDITLLRSYISRNHAEFKIVDDVLWVYDLGSSNGVLVNDVRVKGSHPLNHGDELCFKDVVFQVREDRSQFKNAAMLNQTMLIDKPETPTPQG